MKSYDDIVRETVVEPDSSQRPTKTQERDSVNGPRSLRPDEQQLEARVRQALTSLGIRDLDLEVVDETVSVRGAVTTPELAMRVTDVVAAVPGVERVDNQVVVKR
jgi:osmotically-inducible protein OsmY